MFSFNFHIKKFNTYSFLSACTAILALSSTLSARTYTNNKGKTIEAKILSVKGSKVTLKLDSNNKEYTLPIDTFIKKDQEFIKEWQKENKEAEEKKEQSEESDDTSPSSPQITRFTYENIKKAYKLEDNFQDDWPALTKAEIPDIKIVKEDEDAKKFIYHSENYEFICDVKLSKNVVNKFAHLFEGTKAYCKDLPISLLKAQIPSGTKRYKILLFETKKTYLKNGGPPGSAGVYMSRADVIMVPLSSLGVIKAGSGYRYDYDGSNTTLPHEITHQLTQEEYFNPGARGWFSEGLAEYVSMTKYKSGKFMVRNNLKDIKASVTGFAKKSGRGRNLGEEINVPDLKEYMTMPYSRFTANGNLNYGIGALYTYYFFHMEDDRTNINAFLKALNEGKTGDAALKVLLNGRSYDELEKQIAKAWRSRGVKLNFK